MRVSEFAQKLTSRSGVGLQQSVAIPVFDSHLARAPRMKPRPFSAVCFAASAFLFGAASAAETRTQGRSIVMSREGIVATEQPLASQAGATILAQGGNA